MKLTVAFFLFLIFCFEGTSQKLSQQYGKISRDDFDYQYKKEVDAAVLFDKGKSVFVDGPNGFEIKFDRSRRVKIFNKSGSSYAEISIPFYTDGYGKTERITSIEGITYNLENGQLIKRPITTDAVFEEKMSEFWSVKKFVFPDVKEGSIIEFKYELNTPFFTNLPDWEFQESIPVIYSEYELRTIPFFDYVYWAQGILVFDFKDSQISSGVSRSFAGIEYKEMIHKFVLKNVEPFEDESYITSRNDYIKKINFQLSKVTRTNGVSLDIITTWEKLNEELQKHFDFGKFIKKSGKDASEIIETELQLEGKSELEKAKAVIDYVKESFVWNGSYSIFSNTSSKDLLTERSGNSAAINLFLISMLNEINVSCDPVIISTRNHGKINTDYPFYQTFNHLLVMYTINGNLYITDATDPLINFNRIPPKCINEVGLVVKEGEPQWTNLYNNVNSVDHKMIQMSIDSSSFQSNIMISMQSTEFEAYNYRNNFEDDSVKIKEHFEKYSSFNQIERISTKNYEDVSKPYVINMSGISDLEVIDGNVIVNPFLGMAIRENALKQDSRSYPVDLIYNRTESFQVYIDPPPGFDVQKLPENYTVDNSLMAINLNYDRDNSKIIIKASYELKKAVYQPGEYSRLKSGIDLIVRKFNQQIILEKI